jgi:uncharacterized membrane protein YfcA
MTHIWLICLAGFAAGFVNAIAGGGTLLSFPALMAGGLSAIAANATNTLALWPGSLAASVPYRERLRKNFPLLIKLGIPSMIGGLAGAFLLMTTSESFFRLIVPFLILMACGLLLLNEPIGRWVAARADAHPRKHALLLWLCQLAIGIYGGYFGAGIGIMMLATMAIFLPNDLQTANAIKTILATLINGIATVYFLFAGAIVFKAAGWMGVAAIVGGFVGAHAAQRLSSKWLRRAVVIYGVFVAGYMWWKG